MKPIVTIDFETHPIESRPAYPPRPVGVSILHPDGGGGYSAFGHPTGNDRTEAEARAELAHWFAEAAAGRVELLFFNMKFDLSVACEGWGLALPPWWACHDAMYLAFLNDPHAKKLDLKSLAEKLLNWPPDERNAINDWVVANVKELRKQYAPEKITVSSGKVAHLWRWYARVSGELAGAYANGDVDRTRALFDVLHAKIVDNGMLAPYDRLRQITPILMENERLGMYVDLPRLEEDCQKYAHALLTVEAAIRQYLNAPELNLDADIDMANALDAIGAVTQWVLTETGEKSVSKVNLKAKHFVDQQLYSAIGYRNRLKTALDTFMRPWLEQAKKTGGTIHTNWNITRSDDGGTRTGRPSTSDHNFLNLAKNFETKKDGYVHPDFLSLPPLPLVRGYVQADPGCVFLHRDFSGQELRVFAHFEAGELNAAYITNPSLDPHDEWVRPLMEKAAGREFDRTTIKVLNFQGIYGGGAPALAKALEITVQEAKGLKVEHDRALPGRKLVADTITAIFKRGEAIRTWGGRLYYCEPAGFNKKHGKFMSYEYKGINYEVQGSAADLTLESIIVWYSDPRRDPRVRLLVTVYDETNLSCPPEIAIEQMQVLKEAMEKPRLSVPMLSDGKWGPSWGACVKYDDGADKETLDSQRRAFMGER